MLLNCCSENRHTWILFWLHKCLSVAVKMFLARKTLTAPEQLKLFNGSLHGFSMSIDLNAQVLIDALS